MPAGKAKRKPTASPASAPEAASFKKAKSDKSHLRQPHPQASVAEHNGIVLRKFYPPEMSNERARAYNHDEIPRPMDQLISAMESTAARRKAVQAGSSVVHWFKMDLRLSDNKALALAAEKAQGTGVPLLCIFIASPEDFEAHLRAPARVDFMLRTLEQLQQDLAKLDIPLHVELVDKRGKVPARILSLLHDWGSNHLFANMEYEVDELRREARIVHQLSDKGKSFEVVHDTCVVPPGQLLSGSGKPYAVYSPWYRAWVAHVHDNPDLLELFDPPRKNPPSARKQFAHLFNCPIPEAPKNKQLGADERARLRSLWPSGEHAARSRLESFCKEKIGSYQDTRNVPAAAGTSCLSVHLASGTISARTCIRLARSKNKTKKLDGGHGGIQTWISEVAWRDFYKHVLVNWPYVW